MFAILGRSSQKLGRYGHTPRNVDAVQMHPIIELKSAIRDIFVIYFVLSVKRQKITWTRLHAPNEQKIKCALYMGICQKKLHIG